MSCFLTTFEAKSENITCNFLGLPMRALTDSNGSAALELMAIVLSRLSSGVMNPGIFSSAEGILSRTYRDSDLS